MPVPSTIADLSTTAGSNSPLGSDTITDAAGPDDYLRAHAAIIKTHTEATAEHGATGAVVGTTNSQVLTNKTLTAPVINGIVTTAGLTLPAATVGALNGTTIPTSKTLLTSEDILDEDNMASNSATDAPSQQSVKAYADTKNIATQVTPSTSGNVLTSNGTAWTSAAPAVPITLDTPAASTSGTVVDFPSVPAGTKRITIAFNAVSLDANTNLLIQLGDSGGFETTGYISTTGYHITGTTLVTSTSGFVCGTGTATAANSGAITLTLMDSSNNTWVCSGVLAASGTAASMTNSGVKSLSAELNSVRINSVSGTAAFDAGTINIIYG